MRHRKMQGQGVQLQGATREDVDTRAPLSNTIETTSPTVAAERRGKKNKAHTQTQEPRSSHTLHLEKTKSEILLRR